MASNELSHTASPCVLVLAAGRGERFAASGGTSHKLQAEIAPGITVLQATLAAVRASGLPWHVEYGPHAGMGESIAAAVRATLGAKGWLILPADLPLVRASSLRRVADALAERSREPGLQVVQPCHCGLRGHPVGFSAAAFEPLSKLAGDRGASSVVRQAAQQGGLLRLDMEDEGMVLDVDTMALLEEARQLWQRRGGAGC